MSTASTSRRVFLGMPGYGKQTAAAGRGFWRACADMTQVWNAYQNGSLLASNFNQLWCAALNLVHTGHPLDYFAMLHDDIGPEDFWLDKLIDELEAKQLDVLGVAVPIKDTRGMTSLALHRQGDNWLPHARLSMHDIYELPETFTADDLGHPLLLNTGCWVAKWNQEWCRRVRFEINDRIVFNTAQNRYQAQTEPEDWFFSRLLNEMGLRIGATRKVRLVHQGEIEFANTNPWGSQAFDSESCRVSPVPHAFPRDILGWLFPAEGRTLADLARGKRVLEIGSYCGLSTVCMGRTAQHVTAVDFFDGRGTPAPRDTFGEFMRNIERHGLRDVVVARRPGEPLPLEEYDLIFIDGDHSYDAVTADIAFALPRLTEGGLLAFHDYRHPSHPGVAQAVQDILDGGGELLFTTETLAVVRPPARIPMEV